MPLKGVRYRTVTRGGHKIRLAFRGNTVVEAKNLDTGATHSPAEFRAERKAAHGRKTKATKAKTGKGRTKGS